MTYVDTSVLLAGLLGEEQVPPPEFWSTALVSSRLAAYEVWVRLHARGADAALRSDAASLLNSLAFVEMTPEVLVRAMEPFPMPIRSLDALHLASAHYLHAQGHAVAIV